MMHGQQSAGTRLAVSQFLGPMAIAEGEAGRTGVKVPDLQLGGCPLETKNKREQREGVIGNSEICSNQYLPHEARNRVISNRNYLTVILLPVVDGQMIINKLFNCGYPV